MRSFKKSVVGVAAGLTLAVSQAWAIPTITNLDGAFDPFGGFDWNSAGSAVIQGYSNLTAVGQMSGPVTNTFYANAVQLQNTGGGNFATPNLFPSNAAGTYEYTTVATFTEILTCVAVSAGTCVSLNANIIGGSFNIYYGTGAAVDSNLVTLTGLTNGTPLISGTINAGFAGNTTVVGTGFPGPGSGLIGISLFSGAVTSTNSTFINPALVGTTATATVQYGVTTTAYTRPTGSACGATDTFGCFVVQADANQAFSTRAVPEPGTLALGGLMALALGAIRRRKVA